ncbi:MAG: hypothetical protein H6662_15590 [Ardenticatenaceae bacterium]|nr:hypothetical protein [Anaerolineales bacterium]MCB8923010.1 hypothetical protein [Ardenticatenaceae bacterium]
MTDLVIDYTQVREIEVIEQFTGPADETVDPGHYARLAPSTGKLTKGNATTAAEVGTGEGLCITRQVNTITILKKGILWLGDALDALNFGDIVYLSDTDGTLADAAGTVSKVAGVVVPLYGHSPFKKGLRVDF